MKNNFALLTSLPCLYTLYQKCCGVSLFFFLIIKNSAMFFSWSWHSLAIRASWLQRLHCPLLSDIHDSRWLWWSPDFVCSTTSSLILKNKNFEKDWWSVPWPFLLHHHDFDICSFEWNVWATIGWLLIKLSPDIFWQIPRMNCNKFCYHLTFLSLLPSGHNFN